MPPERHGIVPTLSQIQKYLRRQPHLFCCFLSWHFAHWCIATTGRLASSGINHKGSLNYKNRSDVKGPTKKSFQKGKTKREKNDSSMIVFTDEAYSGNRRELLQRGIFDQIIWKWHLTMARKARHHKKHPNYTGPRFASHICNCSLT